MRKGARTKRSRPHGATLVRCLATRQTRRLRFSILGPTQHNFPEAGFRRSSRRATERAPRLTDSSNCIHWRRTSAARCAYRSVGTRAPHPLHDAQLEARSPTREVAERGCERSTCADRSAIGRRPPPGEDRGLPNDVVSAQRVPTGRFENAQRQSGCSSAAWSSSARAVGCTAFGGRPPAPHARGREFAHSRRTRALQRPRPVLFARPMARPRPNLPSER